MLYCKNCGRILGDNDRFCSNCGEKVESEREPFVPAFMKSYEESSKTFEQPQAAPEKRKPIPKENFDWNLDGFPTANKKTEDIDFNWSAVMEENQRRKYGGFDDRMFLKDEPVAKNEPAAKTLDRGTRVIGAVPEPTIIMEPVTAEKSLEDSLFEEVSSLDSEAELAKTLVMEKRRPAAERVDKFYTYNQKKSELQALLDQEYKRLGEAGPEEEDEPLVNVEDLIGDLSEPMQEEQEPELNSEGLECVGVQLAFTPCGVYADEENRPAAEPAESEAEEEKTASEKEAKAFDKTIAGKELPTSDQPKEKEERKLTFDDVFNSDDDDDEGEGKTKGKALTVIAVILCILLVCQLGMVAIQYFMPESDASKLINSTYNKVIGIFVKDKAYGESPIEDASEIENLIKSYAYLNKNISTVKEDNSLTFEAGRDYGFEDFADAYSYKNEPWYMDNDGNKITYLDGIISVLIQYNSAWIDKMNDGNDDILLYIDTTSDFYEEASYMEAESDEIYCMEKLAIGEVRFDGKGYYVMIETTKASSSETEKIIDKQVVYLEPDNDAMKIVDIKTL